ncbi:MAG: outer rane transport energization protein TonB [Candidatus Sulfotelmatobacter sp.]|nr:outer rane transport energization protein TonB [Candidatus Sulfotelmatobacter sp.]
MAGADAQTAVAAPAWSRDQPSRRRGLRYRVQAPLDVTVLRSGIPESLPGRSVNLGEGGIAAVLAGELVPGEAVGVEILLPHGSNRLHTRALVRHHDKLRSGLEFVGLSAEQQAAIRDWAGEVRTEPELGIAPKAVTEGGGSFKTGGLGGGRPPVRRRRSRTWIVLLVSAGILLAILCWRWNRGWKDLESTIPKDDKKVEVELPQAHVPADVMQKLVIHRVDPDYPAAARPAKLKAVIALDVVVGRDGSVVEIHPLNGPDVLARAAMEALRWWRFEPYRVDGKPVAVETTVAVEFKP